MPAAGYPFHPLRVAGIDRATRSGRRARWRSRSAATAGARRLLRAIGADAVLGGGGYVAGPVGLAARLAAAAAGADRGRQPSGRHQPAARAARPAGVPGLPDRGPRRAAATCVVGRPVPPGTGDADRRRRARALRHRAGRAAACWCSAARSGRARLNEAALDAFGGAAPCAVLHACGRRDHDELRARLDALGRPRTTACTPTSSRSPTRWRPPTWPSARAGGSVLRAGRRRAAGRPRALPARHRRPPDAQRALDGAGGRGRGGAGRRAGRPAPGARGGGAAGGAGAAGGDASGGAAAAGRMRPERIAEEVLALV